MCKILYFLIATVDLDCTTSKLGLKSISIMPISPKWTTHSPQTIRPFCYSNPRPSMWKLAVLPINVVVLTSAFGVFVLRLVSVTFCKFCLYQYLPVLPYTFFKYPGTQNDRLPYVIVQS